MNFLKKRLSWNFIGAFSLTLFTAIVVSILFDSYYDLNDDVLMKDILAGVYTGTPASHNIQMLYPISLIISLFYRLYRTADWYGIFLCVCQYGCIFLIVKRTLDKVDSTKKKILLLFTELILVLSLFMGHLVYLQYTVTVALLSGTAVFLIVSSENLFEENMQPGRKESIRRLVGHLILPCIMIFLAYLIRSELLLLTLPLVGAGVIIKWVMECGESLIHKKGFMRCVFLGVVIVAGIAICQLLHTSAYSSNSWREFTSFFDNRTELYDFQSIPDYDENKEFYDSIGISEEEKNLFDNYNFGLDDEITSETVGEIADYAATINSKESFANGFKKFVGNYVYRLHHTGVPESYEYPQTDAPWNIVSLFMYFATFVILSLFYSYQNRFSSKLGALIKPFLVVVFLFAIRTGLWGYIMMRGRDPIRITHSLYLVEILVLAGIIISTLSKGKETKTEETVPLGNQIHAGNTAAGLCVILIIIGLIYLPSSLIVTSNEQTNRAKVNAPYNELYSYCMENSDNFYFFDVYSSVAYSEKLFDSVNNDNKIANYDIMGGWACKSPLQIEKLSKFGIDDMKSALISMDNVYFVMESDASPEWIADYYAEEGYDITITEVTNIAGSFNIYKLSAE